MQVKPGFWPYSFFALACIAIAVGVRMYSSSDTLHPDNESWRSGSPDSEYQASLPGVEARSDPGARVAIGDPLASETALGAATHPCQEYLDLDEYLAYLDCVRDSELNLSDIEFQLMTRLISTEEDPYLVLQKIREEFGYAEALRFCDKLASYIPQDARMLHAYRLFIWNESPETLVELDSLHQLISARLEESLHGLQGHDLIPALGLVRNEMSHHAFSTLESILLHDLGQEHRDARNTAVHAAFNHSDDMEVVSAWLIDRLEFPSGWDIATVAMRIEPNTRGDRSVAERALIDWASRYPEEWQWVKDNAEKIWVEETDFAQFVRQL